MAEGFSKERSMMAKGVFISLLLFHHLFNGSYLGNYSFSTLIIKNKETMSCLAEYARFCIAGFSFISAYGITVQFKKCKDDEIKNIQVATIKRIIKLMGSIFFIYLVAIIYAILIKRRNIDDIYNGSNFIYNVFYMVLDALGVGSFIGAPILNVSWWYLSYALFLILLMPIIYSLCKRYSIIIRI